MSHQAIYRKYRPKIFDDVLGQEHVTKTLKNQILTNKIAHAYLFSGIRGTGKTSTAKIFSRAVNCLNNTDGNPCNECVVCKSILDETNMDVIEMDAASNNGVDDIRELRDKVKFHPVMSKYKVYIIDEVHMLSKGAFNALLKTLEEPPEHLLFILATTEPHKIPATILSRCQRFDLKRIKPSVIVENMKNICAEIGIGYEESALKFIAANSEGAMRDSLSLLDRCISFSQDKITYDSVISLLGTVSYRVTLDVAKAIIEKDIKKTIVMIDDILNSGKELNFFLDELIIFFRNLLIIKTTNSTESLTRFSEDTLEEFTEISKLVPVHKIVYYIEELSLTQSECKRVLNPKILLETRMIKLLTESYDFEDLLKRIEFLESKLSDDNYMQKEKVKKHTKELPVQKQEPVKIKQEFNVSTEKVSSTENSKASAEGIATNSDEDIFNAITNNWQAILRKIRSENAGLQAIVRECSLVEVVNKKAVFMFDSKFTFHINAANQPKNKTKFKEILSNFLNLDCEVEFTIKSDSTNHKNEKKEQSIENIYMDLKNKYGEDIVVIKED